VINDHNYVDGVEVSFASEAPGEIGFRICGGVEFRTDGAKEAEISVSDFRGDIKDVGD